MVGASWEVEEGERRREQSGVTVESVVGSVGVALRCRIPSAQANEQTDESVSACGRPFSQLGERPPGGLTPFFFWVSVRDQRAAHSTASVRNEPAPKPRRAFPPRKGKEGQSSPFVPCSLFGCRYQTDLFFAVSSLMRPAQTDPPRARPRRPVTPSSSSPCPSAAAA